MREAKVSNNKGYFKMGGSNIVKTQKIVSIMMAVILQVILLSNASYAADDSVIDEISNDDEIKVIDVNEANSSDINDSTQSESLEEANIETEVKEIQVEEEKDVVELEPKEESGDNIQDLSDVTVEDIEEVKVEAKEDHKKKEKKPKKDLNTHLKSLSSKELTKEIDQLTKEELHAYLKDVKGYSDLQINGEIPIINNNGNLFFYSNDRLKPYMVTSGDNEKFLKIQQNKKNKLPNAMPELDHEALTESLVDVIELPDESLEIPILCDEYSKFYKLEDGTNQSLFSPLPIHYRDGDTFKDISVNIKNDSDSTYEYANRENSFKTFFNSYDSLDNGICEK